MKSLTLNTIKLSTIVVVSSLIFTTASPALAKKGISVTTYVDKETTENTFVYAVGFSVNKKRLGSLGRRTTKNGPADATYLFGFKSGKGNIGCGKHTLIKNSTVVMSYNGKTCTSKVFPGTKPS